MASSTTGTVSSVDVPIGMQRLSCLPCRKRKSKCDRSQPCSSCVLRSTERFCYTSTAEEDPAAVLTTAKRDERQKSGSGGRSLSNGASGPSNRPTKLRKTSDRDVGHDSEFVSPASQPTTRSTEHTELTRKGDKEVDRSAILSAIQSIKTTLVGLESSLGQTEETSIDAESVSSTLRWADIRAWLPSKEDSETIIDAFFTEAIWLFPCIHQAQFMTKWREFAEGKVSSRIFVALSIAIMGNGLALAPSSHPAYHLSYKKDSRLFIQRAHQVLRPTSDVFYHIPETSDLMQVHVFLVYYMALNGYADAGDVELGKALRIARAINLFDEEKWNLTQMTDWDVELNRRMAWDVIQLDRYISMHFLRAPTMPLELNCRTADYYMDECYDMPSGRLSVSNLKQLSSAPYHVSKERVSRGAHKTATFLINFLRQSSMERYQSAREVDSFLEQMEMQAMNAELQYEVACNLSSLTSPEAFRRACQSLIVHTSARRQRCTVMRQFLLDKEAPVELRVAALEHAKIIIETVPVLISVSSSPWVAFSPAWCSGHLFCAASTFAIVYLGEEDQHEPSAELDWFASKIFEVLDALSVLGVRDRVAKRCEELLIALCTSRDTLRAKFAASKSGKRQQKGLQQQALQQQQDASAQTSRGQRNANSANGSSAPRSRKEAWPGFRSVISINDSGHIPPGIVNVADAPPRQSPSQQLHQRGSVSSAPNASTTQFFSSPETLPAGTTPSGRSNGSNSMAEEGSDATSQQWWPPLDDGQWSALISSLDGDWSNLIGSDGAANGMNTTLSMPVGGGGINPMNVNTAMPFAPS